MTANRSSCSSRRIAAPYYEHANFRRPADAVPRRRGRPGHRHAGHHQPRLAAEAMRATMSLPLIFPPVELDGRVLVDGGAMNNVPANVVKAMGADKVVAVNVGRAGRLREAQLHAARAGRRHARCDDARLHQGGRCRSRTSSSTCRSTTTARSTGGEPRPDCRGVQGCRVDAGSACCRSR